MIIEYILIGVFITAALGGFVAGIVAMKYMLKMYEQSKYAPFLWRVTGLSHYMSKYQTPQGITYRNKAFTCIFIFIVLWIVGFSIGIKMDSESWRHVKESYKNLPNKANQHGSLKALRQSRAMLLTSSYLRCY